MILCHPKLPTSESWLHSVGFDEAVAALEISKKQAEVCKSSMVKVWTGYGKDTTGNNWDDGSLNGFDNTFVDPD
mgnify:CR=1 FL=1